MTSLRMIPRLIPRLIARLVPSLVPSLRIRRLPHRLARPLAVAVGVCFAFPAMAQVTYFKRPPTPEQLRAALLSPGTAAPAISFGTIPAKGSRSRGIVWQSTGAGTAGSPPLSAGASLSAIAPLPMAVASAPAATPQQGTGQSASPAAALPINFDLGSSRVDRDSLPYIETIASLMRSDPTLQLVIEGHTDDRGAYSRNMVLSWDRALGVFRTLVENYGVEPRRLQPLGKGPLEPMPGTDPSDGANRRVQFRISG